jgi:hypothetical protein
MLEDVQGQHISSAYDVLQQALPDAQNGLTQ